MSLQKRRTERGWTQEQLASHSGLSVRTIQRLEQGQAATLESLKCLAAVFETNVSTLMQEQTMKSSPQHTADTQLDQQEKEAIEYVHNLKWFYMHIILFLVIMPALLMLNLYLSPDRLWIITVAIAWLAGLVLHGVVMFGMFGLFGGAWEQRQFRKRMGINR